MHCLGLEAKARMVEVPVRRAVAVWQVGVPAEARRLRPALAASLRSNSVAIREELHSLVDAQTDAAPAIQSCEQREMDCLKPAHCFSWRLAQKQRVCHPPFARGRSIHRLGGISVEDLAEERSRWS